LPESLEGARGASQTGLPIARPASPRRRAAGFRLRIVPSGDRSATHSKEYRKRSKSVVSTAGGTAASRSSAARRSPATLVSTLPSPVPAFPAGPASTGRFPASARVLLLKAPSCFELAGSPPVFLPHWPLCGTCVAAARSAIAHAGPGRSRLWRGVDLDCKVFPYTLRGNLTDKRRRRRVAPCGRQ